MEKHSTNATFLLQEHSQTLAFFKIPLFCLQSPIFYMRNFNNWVKSVLIRTYIQPHITVMDLCCGKGGDLLKWKEGGIGYIVCAGRRTTSLSLSLLHNEGVCVAVDISESSVEACQGRYWSPRMSVRGTGEPPFGAEFHMADCCTVSLSLSSSPPCLLLLTHHR